MRKFFTSLMPDTSFHEAQEQFVRSHVVQMLEVVYNSISVVISISVLVV